jgi:hypothetical protein
MEYRLLKTSDMAVLSRHRFAEGLLSISSIGVLLAAVAASNETFRIKLAGLLSGESSNELAIAGGGLQRIVHTVTETVGSNATMHTPLVLFVLVAAVLLVLMLRP